MKHSLKSIERRARLEPIFETFRTTTASIPQLLDEYQQQSTHNDASTSHMTTSTTGTTTSLKRSFAQIDDNNNNNNNNSTATTTTTSKNVDDDEDISATTGTYIQKYYFCLFVSNKLISTQTMRAYLVRNDAN